MPLTEKAESEKQGPGSSSVLFEHAEFWRTHHSNVSSLRADICVVFSDVSWRVLSLVCRSCSTKNLFLNAGNSGEDG